MEVCVTGTGNAGLTVETCLTEMGNDVICIDNNEDTVMEIMQELYAPFLNAGNPVIINGCKICLCCT